MIGFKAGYISEYNELEYDFNIIPSLVYSKNEQDGEDSKSYYYSLSLTWGFWAGYLAMCLIKKDYAKQGYKKGFYSSIPCYIDYNEEENISYIVGTNELYTIIINTLVFIKEKILHSTYNNITILDED